MICIKRRMYGGEGVEHVIALEWRNVATGKSDRSSVHALVDWIEKGNQLYCESKRGGAPVPVYVERPPGRRAFLRTQPSGSFDNLLALPVYGSEMALRAVP